MTDKLRVGIAGYGIVGKRRRAVIDVHANLQTVAVCDRTFDGDGVLPDGAKYFSDYRRLLDEDLDILFVCLSNDVAAETTIAGLKRGFHVFCEKPPGRDLADIAAVVVQAKSSPALKLKYGFNHRYHDSVRRALSIVQSGELGPVINLRGVYGKSKIINFESDWRTRRAVAGGGILLDQGIHMVDLLRLFAGEFDDIHSFISNAYWKHDVEDNAYALMRTSSGVVAMLHSTATQWQHRFHLEIALAKGAIVLSGILSGSKSYGAETLTVASKTAAGDAADPDERVERFTEDNSWRDEVDDFADAILADRPILSGSAQDALETMRLVYRIYCADPAWKSRFQLSDSVPGFDR